MAGAVFAAGSRGRLTLEEVAFETVETDPGESRVWEQRVAAALGALAKRGRWPRRARLALPAHLVLTKSVRTPAVPAAARAKVAAFEAAQAIPYPLPEVVWDHTCLGDHGDELEWRFTTVKRETMERLAAAVEQAGWRLERAWPAAQALPAAFRFAQAAPPGPVLLADIGARSTSLLLLDGTRAHSRTIPLGGNVITAELAAGLALTFDEAESVKRQSVGSDLAEHAEVRESVRRAAGTFAGELHGEMVRFLAVNRSAGATAPAPVTYLSGGGSLLPGLPALLAEKLKVEVVRYDALRQVDLTSRACASGASSSPHLLVNLVGLAQLGATAGKTGVALLPPRLRQRVEFRSRLPWLVATAALLVIALGVPAWHYHQLARATATRASEAEERLVPLQAIAQRNADNLEKIREIHRRLSALRVLAAAKAEWIGLLADLQERLAAVDHAWIDRLQLLPAATGAGGPGRALEAKPAVQWAVAGCLLDPDHPAARISPESSGRVRQLLHSLGTAALVAEITDERFDDALPGLLRFDFVMALGLARDR